jgi:hypothetical protein
MSLTAREIRNIRQSMPQSSAIKCDYTTQPARGTVAA